MGAKFLHTHVHTADAGAVADALRELARLRRLSVAADDEPCHHQVVVAVDPASPAWTSIYGRFDDVSCDLSAALETDVVVTSIFDGDVLEASFYCEGAVVDVFSTDPDFEGPRRAVRGQPRRWDRLCLPPSGWRDVQRIFKAAKESPEDALIALGRAIGLDARSLYPDHLEPTSPSARRLRFRNPPAPRRRIVDGPPVVYGLRDFGFDDESRVVIPIKAEGRDLVVSVGNAGGGSTGLEIALGGDALREGLVTIERLTFRGSTRALVERKEPDGVWLVADLPQSGLPAASGLVDEHDRVPVVDHHPSVHLELKLAPSRVGRGELHVRWTPLEPAGLPGVQRIGLAVEA